MTDHKSKFREAALGVLDAFDEAQKTGVSLRSVLTHEMVRAVYNDGNQFGKLAAYLGNVEESRDAAHTLYIMASQLPQQKHTLH